MSKSIHSGQALWWALFVLFAVIGAYALLSSIAGASLACVPCDCIYTLNAENSRCRWPAIWEVLFYAASGAALVSAGFAIWSYRHWVRQKSH